MKLLFKKQDVYKSHCYLIQYNDNYFKVVLNKYQREKGFEEISKKNIYFDYSDEYQRQSLSRTKRNLKEICLCNEFKYFTTLTINSKGVDRYNLELCQGELKKILKKIKRKNKNFKYIFITEKHKDGAFHFHGLITDIDFYKNNNGYLSNYDFDILGFNSFSPIKNYNKCCNYITKYITKDCIKNLHNQVYICSRGLKRAIKYEIPLVDIEWGFENDFVKIKEFSCDELKRDEIFQFLDIS